jgi:hypothetical protein
VAVRSGGGGSRARDRYALDAAGGPSDQCAVTPYGDAARLADKYPLISVFGGRAPESGPCDPFNAHSYFGKESETVEQIVNWMLKKPFLEEVR